MGRTKSRVRVYIACSLDGFIAGPDDDLSWLPQGGPGEASESGPGAVGFEQFMAGVGALLMGRRTYDVIAGFGGWPYGDCPVLVPTHRPLDPVHPSVKPFTGSIAELVAAAQEVADGRDVYLDGGNLIRQAIDAHLVDDMIVTIAPVVLGQGHPLFAGACERHSFEFVGHHDFNGMVQLHARFVAGS